MRASEPYELCPDNLVGPDESSMVVPSDLLPFQTEGSPLFEMAMK